MLVPYRCLLLLVLPVIVLLNGCSLSTLSTQSDAAIIIPRLSGAIHGGQQPVSGALIHLFAANTVTLQGPSTPLTSSAVYSDAAGMFSITGDFTCPSPGALVYIVATGGNPGLPGIVTNTNIAMMTVLGTCSSLTASSYISVNELTTVAAVEALAPFMLDYSHVGAVSSSSLAIAFSNAVANVSPTSGQLIPTSSGAPVPAVGILNTLADILAACVNTAGGSLGSSSPCGQLNQYAPGNSANTISSLLHIVQNPLNNVPSLFALITPSSPFQPILSSAPSSLAFYISSSVGVLTSHTFDQLFSDSDGHIWHYQPAAGLLTQYDTSLNRLHSYAVYNGSVGNGIGGIATLDPLGNLWVPISPITLMEIGADGTVKSPPGGYTPQTGGLYGPLSGVQADSAGNIWAAVVRADYAVCAVEYSPNFALLSPATGYCSSYSYGAPIVTASLVADTAGNIYELNLASSPNPILKYSASGNVSTLAALTGTAASGTYDSTNNRILSVDEMHIESFRPDGSLVFMISLQAAANFSLRTSTNSLTTDGAGNLWLATTFGRLAAITPAGLNLTSCVSECGIPIDTSTVGTLAGIAVDPAGDIFTVDTASGTLLKYSALAVPR